jgi:hypothetical protein
MRERQGGAASSRWSTLGAAAARALTQAHREVPRRTRVDDLFVDGNRCTALLRQMTLFRPSDGAFLKLRIKGHPNAALTPLHWEPQLEDEAKLIEVPRGTDEFTWACAAMMLRNPTVVVEKVERVQDVELWSKYAAELELRARGNGGDPNERWLFHGTGGAAPKAIWHDGDGGFDARMSSAGYFGRNGAYFSESAHYSDQGYSHMLCCGEALDDCFCGAASGPAQMFIASVVCGHSKDYGRSQDRGLKRPPVREGGSSKLFDSIHSAPDDPSYGMWVVWQNAQAYPRYVVTYRSKCAQGSASSRSTAAQGLLRTLYGGSGGAASTMIDALIDASLPPPPPWVVPTIAEVRVACIKGDLTVLAAYLRAGGNPNAVDVDGVSFAEEQERANDWILYLFMLFFSRFSRSNKSSNR